MKYRWPFILLLLLPFVVAPGARAYTEIDHAYITDAQYFSESTDVFVGKVLDKTDPCNVVIGPNTFTYNIHVLLTIKGGTQGTVPVRIQTWDGQGCLHLGATYIFLTKYASDTKAYSDVEFYDNQRPLTTDSSLSDFQLLTLASADSRVVGFVKQASPQPHEAVPASEGSAPTSPGFRPAPNISYTNPDLMIPKRQSVLSRIAYGIARALMGMFSFILEPVTKLAR